MNAPPGALTEAEAIAACRQLSVITILLGGPLGADARFDFPSYAGRKTYPRDGLDVRDLPPDFDFGQAFVGFSIGLPHADRQLRSTAGELRDGWAPDGKMRRLSRLVASLADRATGVILHRAGDLVVPIDRFVALLGDLADPACKPFGAWLDLALTERHGKTNYATFGMDAFGLPDVLVGVDRDDPDDRARAHEAASFACYAMIRDHRELVAGELVSVPVHRPVGAYPLALAADDGVASYRASDDGSHLRITPVTVIDPAATWARLLEATPLNVYQLLFDRGLSDFAAAGRTVPAYGAAIPHAIEERARRDGRGFLVVTSGFGRVPQPDFSVPAANVEVAFWTTEPSLPLLRLLGGIASLLHRSETGGWKANDLLGLPVDERGIGGFVLVDLGLVRMGGGPSVSILGAVPLTADEYERARNGHAAEWLEKNQPDEHRWARFRQR